MNPLIQFKATTLPLLIAFVLACFALLPTAQAVTPAPDGGYPRGNTAEGTDALQSLTTGSHNTAVGARALFSTNGDDNTAFGWRALYRATGFDNTATGSRALYSNDIGFRNTATGKDALMSNTTGSDNTATGFKALSSNVLGVFNTAIGEDALISNTSGISNIALGNGAGDQLTTGNNNIDIGNIGVADESNTIRIGTTAAGDSSYFQSSTFIAGTYGATTGSTTTLPVIVDENGQLGTTASSERFKTKIKPMDKTSEAILALKPVTFHYKNDSKGMPQFGLIAEEVAKVNPALVVHDAKGEIYTVRYEAVNAMLLNEFLKEHRKVEELKSAMATQEAIIAKQQEGMEALTAHLKEQDSKIEKVTAQLEASEPALNVVLNNP